MKPSHSPAPWLAHGRYVRDAGGHEVAIVNVDNTMHPQAWRHNVDLLAEAPEMLAALRRIRRGDLHQRVRPLFDDIAALLARIEGAP